MTSFFDSHCKSSHDIYNLDDFLKNAPNFSQSIRIFFYIHDIDVL